MSGVVHVEHKEGDLFEIGIRQHLLFADQPIPDGGGDAAPTPTELFVAGLAACVAFYARRYLARHDLPTAGLAVTVTFGMADHPARIGHVKVVLTLPEEVPDERRTALLAVASNCTLQHTLDQPPPVSVELAA